MNILFIFYTFIKPERGGVQRVTDLLGKGLAERGHSVYFLSLKEPVNTLKEQGDFSCRQLAIDGYDRDPDKYLEDYISILKDKKIEYVISQEYNTISHFLLSNTPAGIKKVSVHHLQPFGYIGKERKLKLVTHPESLYYQVIKWLTIIFPVIYRRKALKESRREFTHNLQSSDALVFLSERFKTRVVRFMPEVETSKLHAINNPNTFKIEDAQTYIQQKQKLIIFVGRLVDPPKNIKGFLDMWRLFSKDHHDWKAQIIGDGPEMQRCRNYIKTHNLKRIQLMGSCKNVADFYKRASFICLTSVYEGWGMVLTEGMAYGCLPVVFDSYESAYDIINDGENGIISKSFSAADMAERIGNVINKPSEIKLMQESAKKTVERFNLDVILPQWENLLQSL